MPRSALILLLAVVAEAAFAGGTITVRLDAQSNSGQTGTATLQAAGEQTKVVIKLANVPAGVAQPAHIHRGTCDNLDKAPRWSLKAVQDGRSVTLVPVALDTILKQPMAINIHKSAIETQIYVACGDIVGTK